MSHYQRQSELFLHLVSWGQRRVPLDPSRLKALFDESHLSCQSHSYSSLYNKNPKENTFLNN